MRTDSLRDAHSFEELIKYIFADYIAGLENAMTMVSEELRGFGERGMSLYHVVATTNDIIRLSSSSSVSCRRKGKSNNTLREHYDHRNIFLKRYCDDSSDVYFRQFFGLAEYREFLLVPIACVQRFVWSQQLAWDDMEKIFDVGQLLSDAKAFTDGSE